MSPTAFREFAGRGRYVLASCDEGQLSLELPQYSHGLFTYHLLQGMHGAGDRDRDGRVGLSELFEYVSEAVASDARKVGLVQKPWHSFIGPGGVHISEVASFSAEKAAVGNAQPGSGHDDSELFARIAAAGDPELLRLIPLLERPGASAGIPHLLPLLTHRSKEVSHAAGKALLGIGWRNTASAIERLARRGQTKEMELALEGLSAFEAHHDIVELLERLVPVLHGPLRNRAVLLLERKRLALTTDQITALFEKIGSPYRIERALGQGLFASCYRALDERFGLDVVVRVLRPEFSNQPELVALYLDLGRTAYSQIHQNLLAVREVASFPDERLHFIVRDYVDGITLQQFLQSGGRLDPLRAVEILRQVAEALGPARHQGQVHGGIKPANIFLREDGRVFLGDRSLPAHQCQVGLPRLAYDFLYSAPETHSAKTALGVQSDFYSLGCVAYEIVTGTPPFVSDEPLDLAIGHARDPVPELKSTRVELGEEGKRWIYRLLSKKPQERFRDVHELLAALRGIEVSIAAQDPRSLQLEAALIRDFQSRASFISMMRSPSSEMAKGGLNFVPIGDLRETLEEAKRRGYEIDREIGRGGMATVYAARQASLDRRVVLKVIRGVGNVESRFFREAMILAKLSHPHIVPVYDLFRDGDLLVIAMLFLGGGSLDRPLARSSLQLCVALQIAHEIAQGLQYAHTLGIIHRDIKPSNILLDENGTAYLSDFGLASILDARQRMRLTDSGTIMGTLSYMAPEQLISSSVDDKADVFSLGATLFEMLSRRLPWPADSLQQNISRAVRGDIMKLREAARKIPPPVAGLVDRMLHRNPEKRPNAGEVVATIQELRKRYCEANRPGKPQGSFWKRFLGKSGEA